MAILSLQPNPGKWGETQEAYESRARVIATAVVGATHEKQVALAIVTVFWFESRFNIKVHDGSVTGDNGRARCMGQLHSNRRLTRDLWLALPGTDLESTRRCAQATARALSSARWMCVSRHIKGDSAGWAGAFRMYGTGYTCVAHREPRRFGSVARLRTHNRLRYLSGGN